MIDSQALKQRTKLYGLRIINLVESLPRKRSADVIGRQLLRCGTSVGANYRSACRGQSHPDFISKLSIAIEEADESLYRMEMLVESELVPEIRLADLMKEGDEITAILTASVKTARGRQNKSQEKG